MPGGISPAGAQAVHRLLQRVVDSITALPEPVLNELYRPLMLAQAELERDLAQLVKGWPDGGETFGAHHLRAALRQTRAAMAQIDHLAPKIAASLDRGARASGALSNKNLEMEIARLSEVFDGEIPLLDLPTLEHVLEQTNWLTDRYDRLGLRYSTEAKAAIRQQFAIGVAKNETFDQLANRIMRLGGNIGGRGVQTDGLAGRMATGLFSKRYTDAERLVRTEMMNAYNAQHQAAIAEVGDGMKKRWDSAADRRRCPLCRELDGEVREASEPFSSGQMHPPRHPYCRCVCIPWKDSWPALTQLPPLEDRNAQRLATAGSPAAGRASSSFRTRRSPGKVGKTAREA